MYFPLKIKSFRRVLPKIASKVENIIIGTCILRGRDTCMVGRYFFVPRDALKIKNGTKNDISKTGSIQALLDVRSVVLIKLKIESRSITKNTINAVPDESRSNPEKKSPIFLIKIKHLAFSYQHFEGNVVGFVRKLFENELRIRKTCTYPCKVD